MGAPAKKLAAQPGREDLAAAAAATERSRLLGLLATVFGGEPGLAFIRSLKTPQARAALDEAGVMLGAEFFDTPDQILLNDLAIEYTRLFIGPGPHIPPLESVQLKRGSAMIWGPETAVVKRFIEAAGFDYESSFTGIPDHIAVEFEFLARLCATEADAWRAGDSASASASLQWQHKFISKHLGKWAANFLAKVLKAAEQPFYAAFAGLAINFMATEKATIMHRLESTETRI